MANLSKSSNNNRTIYIGSTSQKFKDNPIYEINIYQPEKTKGISIDFDEFVIRQEGESYFLQGLAKPCKEATPNKTSDYDNTKDAYLFYEIHTKPYKVFEEEKEPNKTEKAFLYFIENNFLKLNTYYRCKISFYDEDFFSLIDNKHATPTLVNWQSVFEQSLFHNLYEFDKPQTIEDLKVGTNSKSKFSKKGYSSSGQSEYERRKDKEKHLCEFVYGLGVLKNEPKNLSELYVELTLPDFVEAVGTEYKEDFLNFYCKLMNDDK